MTSTRHASSPPVPMEHVLGDSDFECLRQLILAELGTETPLARKALVEAQVLGRLRQLGLSTFTEYRELVSSPGQGDRELVRFLDMMTTNETAFFRERAQLDALARELLPQLVEDALSARRGLRIWSAACSNGAEVWTLAMMLDDLRIRTGKPFSFELLGTDASTEMLLAAVKATYPAGMLAAVPEAMRRRYVLPSNDSEMVCIAPTLKQRATFQRLNLMAAMYPIPTHMDLVFLRNVLIYFDPARKSAVLRKVAAHLRPGGVLCLGLAETLSHADLGLERLGASRYRKASK